MLTLSLDTLYASLPSFALRIQTLLDDLGLDLTPFEMDHIALRVNDEALAKHLHHAWLTKGKTLSINNINGRPIAVVKTERPLCVGPWCTSCVELPYPGKKKYAKEGWEHAEWVIPVQASTPASFLEAVFLRFPALKSGWDLLEKRGIEVKLSSPSGEGERLQNPTLAFKAKGICIKLHPVSLEAVINSEQKDPLSL